jgi:hypothetical protein
MIKSRKMAWASHAARIEGRADKVLVEKPEGRDHWEDVGRKTILKRILNWI